MPLAEKPRRIVKSSSLKAPAVWKAASPRKLSRASLKNRWNTCWAFFGNRLVSSGPAGMPPAATIGPGLAGRLLGLGLDGLVLVDLGLLGARLLHHEAEFALGAVDFLADHAGVLDQHLGVATGARDFEACANCHDRVSV